jgi:hypothetical protein
VAEAQTSPIATASYGRRFSRWLVEELRTLAPSVLFFLVSFGVILLIIKLFLARYAIQFEVLSNAVLGAFIAAKVALVLDKISWARAHGWPRIAIVAIRTLLYCVGVIAFGILERLVHGFRETGSLGGAVHQFVEHFDPHRFFAIVLMVSLVFGVYFAMREINNSMGRGALYALFFQRQPHEAGS